MDLSGCSRWWSHRCCLEDGTFLHANPAPHRAQYRCQPPGKTTTERTACSRTPSTERHGFQTATKWRLTGSNRLEQARTGERQRRFSDHGSEFSCHRISKLPVSVGASQGRVLPCLSNRKGQLRSSRHHHSRLPCRRFRFPKAHCSTCSFKPRTHINTHDHSQPFDADAYVRVEDRSESNSFGVLKCSTDSW